ncbi:hypothetical protein GP486_003581 [Trichoglossum hirsutum]|uniref:DNA-binding protein REB1 n=1 Tax=Trichoglossum hirsutum TaxID=265104 RepID=A0A9P8LCC4_9PEZI|nr:hypothetical protein GP486_003581 [Trichoglossum hirsutum]
MEATTGDTEKRKKKSRHGKRHKHAATDEFDQENAQDEPRQAGDSPPTKRRTKRNRTGERHKKASKLDSEHSKEEESARALLEMKSAAAVRTSLDQEEDLALSPQITTDRQADDSSPANVRAYDPERRRRKHAGHKSGKRRRSNKDHEDEQGGGVPAGNSSMDGVITHMDEILSAAYPVSTEQHSQSFHPMSEVHRPLDGFTPTQRPAQDATMTHSYSDVSAYSEHSYRAGTPPYGSEDTPPLHSTESREGSPNGPSVRGSKRGVPHEDVDLQDDNTFTSYGREGKRRKVLDPTDEHMNAALAHAATAANALIDPVLTGQPPLWTIVDGKAAYMGKIVNPSTADKTTRNGKAKRKEGPKRKHRLTEDDLGESNPATVDRKPRKRARKSVVPEMSDPAAASQIGADGQVIKTKGGPFSEHEENLLKQFMDGYKLEHGLTEQELNARVWAERRLNRDDFWDQVSAILPYRPRQSIYKYCRRQFHNFPKRGQWTPEEDEELAVATKEHPQQWKIVGSLLNRMPEDCRDRWRNYLKCGEARKRDVWTEQEENQLRQHVREVIALLGREKAPDASASRENVLSDEEVDRKASLVNWTVISEKMGGTRSRIQCSYKWKKLQKTAAREQEQAIAEQNKIEVEPQPKKTWRAKKAEGNFFKMLPGDKYELLKALKDSGTYEEKNIPWKLVGSPEFCKTWNLTDRKTAYKFLKQSVPNHENMTLQDIVSELLKGLEQLQPDLLSMHFIPPPVSPKRRRKSKRLPSTEAVTEETGDNRGSSHDVYEHRGDDGHQGGRGIVGQSGDYAQGLPMEEDRYLGGGEVDEHMAQKVQLLRHA